MKTGFVSIIGKTNAGKSTLINKLVKTKVSIVSPKQQTTRNAIQGIYNDEEAQIVFVDTPGILHPHQKLDEYMNKQAFTSLAGVDAVILLIDSSIPFNKEQDYEIQPRLVTLDCPLFLVFSKIDLTNYLLVNNLKKEYGEMFPKAEIIEISSLKNFNLDDLIKKIKDVLPDGEKYYPDDIKSDHPVSFLIAEMIREQILLLTHEEVPHCVAIKIDKIEKHNDAFNIEAQIICDRDSQKGIIIGKQGRMIKKIGIESRKEIEKLLGRRANLSTVVRVQEKWRNSIQSLRKLGYSEEE